MPTPRRFTVSVVCQGADLTDDVLRRLFTALGDVVPAERDGALTITAEVEEAPDEVEAAMFLVEAIQDAVPEATVVRLDQDLVSISDIASRTSRNRESVRLLVEGKRGPGRFPPPVGTVGDAIRIWPWAVVLHWFRDELDEDLGEEGISPEAAAEVDTRLARARTGHEATHRAHVLAVTDTKAQEEHLDPRVDVTFDRAGAKALSDADLLLDHLLNLGMLKGASKVHLETQAQGIRVRYRIGDDLQDDAVPAGRRRGERLTARIRERAGLSLSVDAPGQGTFTVRTTRGTRVIEVDTMPAVNGVRTVLTFGPLSTESDAEVADALGETYPTERKPEHAGEHR